MKSFKNFVVFLALFGLGTSQVSGVAAARAALAASAAASAAAAAAAAAGAAALIPAPARSCCSSLLNVGKTALRGSFQAGRAVHNRLGFRTEAEIVMLGALLFVLYQNGSLNNLPGAEKLVDIFSSFVNQTKDMGSSFVSQKYNAVSDYAGWAKDFVVNSGGKIYDFAHGAYQNFPKDGGKAWAASLKKGMVALGNRISTSNVAAKISDFVTQADFSGALQGGYLSKGYEACASGMGILWKNLPLKPTEFVASIVAWKGFRMGINGLNAAVNRYPRVAVAVTLTLAAAVFIAFATEQAAALAEQTAVLAEQATALAEEQATALAEQATALAEEQATALAEQAAAFAAQAKALAEAEAKKGGIFNFFKNLFS